MNFTHFRLANSNLQYHIMNPHHEKSFNCFGETTATMHDIVTILIVNVLINYISYIICDYEGGSKSLKLMLNRSISCQSGNTIV